MTIPGVPCIYYGDEIGMPGGNDPDNRRMMRFDNLTAKEKEQLEKVKKVIHARKNNLALIYGDFNELILKDDIWVFMRKYFNQYAIVIFSKKKSPASVSVRINENGELKKVKAVLSNKFYIEDNTLNVALSPYGVEIILIQE